MASTVLELTKDVWTKVLTNVTNKGQVFIIDQEIEPTSGLMSLIQGMIYGLALSQTD